MNISKRKGQIKISRQALNTYLVNSNINTFFEYFVPCGVEYDMHFDTFIYKGYSEMFDEIDDDGEIPPLYELIVQKIENRKPKYTYEVKRLDTASI